MYARTEFIYAVLLVVSFIEGSQATLQVRATLASASPSVSSTAMFSFQPLPQPTSCASATFFWSYSGPVDPLLLQVTNVNVSQDAPPSTTASSTTTSSTTTSSTSSSPIATTRNLARSTPTTPISLMNLTATLATNYDPLNGAYVWNPVNVSQGWYTLLATISTNPILQTSSPPFFIRTGSNTSCLEFTAIISATNTHVHTITPSASSLSSSIPASDLSTTSTSKVPTIVGVTVGMSVLVIGSLLVWFILTRRRKSRTSDGNNKNSFHRWKGLGDSRGGFDANAPNKRYISSRSHLTSQPSSIVSTLGPEFEGGIIGAEKRSEDQGVALSNLPVLHHQSSRTRPDHTYSASSSSSNVNDFGKSSVRYSTQHSIDSSAVYPPSLTFSSRESGQPDVLRSHSLTGTQYSLTNSIDPSLSSSLPAPPSIASRESKQMHRQSLGKKRKPAPVYDPSEDEPISSALPLSPNTELMFPELSHKSSFGPCGIEGKQLHYLIPDMPLSQS